MIDRSQILVLCFALCASADPAWAQHKDNEKDRAFRSPLGNIQTQFAESGSIPLVGGGDDCSAPELIIGTGSFPYDLTAATTGTEGQANPNCFFSAETGIANDVWFVWSAPTPGLYRIDTCNSNNLDTKLAVYETASCPSGVTALACDDDSCSGLPSLLDVCATSGQTFFIQVGLFPSTTPGSGMLTITNFAACVSNDLCSSATDLGSSTGTFVYNNHNATTGSEGQNESACAIFGSTEVTSDIWYTWTAPSSGVLFASNCGNATALTKLAVYAGAGCPTGSALACSGANCSTGPGGFVSVPVTAGQSYMIQIGNFLDTAGSPGALRVDFTPGSCTSTPATYCAGMVSSSGCTPTIGAIGGVPSLSSPTTFFVSASGLETQKFGLVFYGTTGPDNAPFFGGTLCVQGPLYRMDVQNSSGGGFEVCTGTISQSLSDLLTHPIGGPLLVLGQQVNAQIWTRDPAGATGVNLTNGLMFTICP